MTQFYLLLAAVVCSFGGFNSSISISAEDDNTVAATVDGFEISDARVLRQLQLSLGNREPSDSMLRRLKTEALDHLINRHLVLLSVESRGGEIGPGQIALEVSKLEDRLKEIGKSLDDHLETTNTTKAGLQYEFRWQLAWSKYLEKHMTRDNLEQFYLRNQRKYDGTKVRLSHVLLKGDSPDVVEQAADIRNQIVAGKLAWNDAVEKYSIARSSKVEHGDVGWIGYHGPMIPQFCQAGIELNQDEISQPVKTQFGIHLIKCDQVQPGKVGFVDAKQLVRRDAMKFLFEKLAQNQKALSKIVINH